MQIQFMHDALPYQNHDERARQAFAQSLKLHLAAKVVQGNRDLYERRVRPEFERQQGRPPKDRREVAGGMRKEPFYQLWGALQRTSQEIAWNSVLESVERQLPELAKRAQPPENAIGSLTLDGNIEQPSYTSAIDIHCMSGGYAAERMADDVSAGALYDRGVYIYAMGGFGADNGAMGRTMIDVFQQLFPDRSPARILDLGCTVGHSTLPWAEAYPRAEVHAVDVAAPVLRYGHARSEAMGVPVHFRQANAERLPYEDTSFDLIVSHILLHETSTKAVRNILAECHRLLKPNGVTLHVDLSLYQGMDPFEAFMLDWDTQHNNEPFWTAYREMDAKTLMTDAGFTADSVVSAHISRTGLAAHVFSDNRDAGGRKNWQCIGAVKTEIGG
ncbi:MAG: class I SAM-dependent methyltransferase [Alphaproteobacteria bacterium]